MSADVDRAATRDDRAAWDAVRSVVPEVLSSLLRRHGDFAACEDAVQEALAEAVVGWPAHGWPRNPAAWLTTVAARRLTDGIRSETARRRREQRTVATRPLPGAAPSSTDDTLTLLHLCCHPTLTAPSQVALTLRAVAGLTTAEIARAYLVPEATTAQRISRAKQRIATAGARFGGLDAAERAARTDAVLAVLYLTFNEGYLAAAGDSLVRADLAEEAVRLTRMRHAEQPDDGEIAGLLALMLLHESRRATRVGASGELVPLDDQDRSQWDAALIAEGVELVSAALAAAPLGPYQLQAAIAAVHAEAPTADATDWPQILGLYSLLERIAPSPAVRLNRVVAVAMVQGAAAGLDELAAFEEGDRTAVGHRFDAVRGHLLERSGDPAAAGTAFLEAARRTTSTPEQRYLRAQARAMIDN